MSEVDDHIRNCRVCQMLVEDGKDPDAIVDRHIDFLRLMFKGVSNEDSDRAFYHVMTGGEVAVIDIIPVPRGVVSGVNPHLN